MRLGKNDIPGKTMVATSKSVWSLVWGKPEVDPADLAGAIAEEVEHPPLDFRTRLLIRDGVDALRQHWGQERLMDWLSRCSGREKIEALCRENLGAPGFPSLKERLMEKTDPEVVRQYFRDLGTHVHHPLRLTVGGSIALILPGLLGRATEDIDVVDEVPAEIRSQRRLLDDLRQRYGLLLTHFQAHFLPLGWDQRLQYLDSFGQLRVYLVDSFDIFLSKLFSIRTKDLDDLRLLAPKLDKDILIQRWKETTASLLASAELRKQAQQNWYIVYGEDLPS